MLKLLEKQALRADLASVEGLLSERTSAQDPIGWMQFSKRAERLRGELERLEAIQQTSAAVGLFFGGKPVLGSKGIQADFGSEAIIKFQEVVTTKMASTQGPLAMRGPIPQRDRAQLMITDVARGSFGFVLEEAAADHLVDSSLKKVVDETVDLLYRMSAPDHEAFELALETVDDRLLHSLQHFFRLLDEAGATLRLVEGDREFSLLSDAIDRGRQRTDALSVSEESVQEAGKLYILPEGRRFELHGSTGEILRGSIPREKALSAPSKSWDEFIGKEWIVLLTKRVVQMRSQTPRTSYFLEDILDDFAGN
ncbi:hypothetical protein [Terrihabitans sp. B22-R8]|uniref:hypothetical protein n=1 Tax=Terrihabitans sp. B22-R8 TaxID=3425128 RepID=UPI00403C3EE7